MLDFEKSEILSLKKITKTFGDFQALKNVTFCLQAGEVHSLLGENGAGKSTLMNVAAGLYTADSGEILFDDRLVNITGPSKAKDLGIGMVHQHYKLVEKFSAIQNIEAINFIDLQIVCESKLFQYVKTLVSTCNLIFPSVKCQLLSSKELKY